MHGCLGLGLQFCTNAYFNFGFFQMVFLKAHHVIGISEVF